MRVAVLALLAEEPRHGYAIMNELTARSGGLWRPSPGSVYPVLQQLQDEGLVTVDETDGKKIFSLSDAGREEVSSHPEEYTEPWRVTGPEGHAHVRDLMQAVGGVGAAAHEVARHGTTAQAVQAQGVLDDARRALYRILAEDAPAGDDTPTPS